AEFCKNFANTGKCYGVNCKYIHGSKSDEMQYKQTRHLSVEQDAFWKRSQAFQQRFCNNDPNVCWDHIQSKCFRFYSKCSKGKHPMLREYDPEMLIPLVFVASDNLKLAYKTLTKRSFDWQCETLSNVHTPFRLLFAHIKKQLVSIKMPPEYNFLIKFVCVARQRKEIQRPNFEFRTEFGTEDILGTDTPDSFRLKDWDRITVDIEDEELFSIRYKSQADIFCSICLKKAKKPTFVQCGHPFCNKCVRDWLNTKGFCPECSDRICYLFYDLDSRLATQECVKLDNYGNNESRKCVIASGVIHYRGFTFQDILTSDCDTRTVCCKLN
ncbi:hypothetical protein B4U80_11706, partial [Leptotrombidium deliense]